MRRVGIWEAILEDEPYVPPTTTKSPALFFIFPFIHIFIFPLYFPADVDNLCSISLPKVPVLSVKNPSLWFIKELVTKNWKPGIVLGAKNSQEIKKPDTYTKCPGTQEWEWPVPGQFRVFPLLSRHGRLCLGLLHCHPPGCPEGRELCGKRHCSQAIIKPYHQSTNNKCWIAKGDCHQ